MAERQEWITRNESDAAAKKERMREAGETFGPLEGHKGLMLTLLRSQYKDHQKEIQRKCKDCTDRKDPETWCVRHRFGGRAWILWL